MNDTLSTELLVRRGRIRSLEIASAYVAGDDEKADAIHQAEVDLGLGHALTGGAIAMLVATATALADQSGHSVGEVLDWLAQGERAAIGTLRELDQLDEADGQDT